MIGTLMAKRAAPKSLQAFNERDLDKVLEGWHEDAVLEYPGDIEGVSGIYKGKGAIRKFYERDLEQFPELRISLKHVAVTNLFDLTGNNVMYIHWDAEATNKDGFKILNSGIHVMKVEGGKVKQNTIFIFDTGEKFRKAWETSDHQV